MISKSVKIWALFATALWVVTGAAFAQVPYARQDQVNGLNETQPQATFSSSLPRAMHSVCSRTPQVRQAILDATFMIQGLVFSCDQITRQDLIRITQLDLSHLYINTLRRFDFEGLDSLSELNLSDNAIHALPPGLFSDLSNLSRLSLSSNRLTNLNFNNLNLPTSNKIEILLIDNNHIAALPLDISMRLPLLNVLGIGGNPFDHNNQHMVQIQQSISQAQNETWSCEWADGLRDSGYCFTEENRATFGSLPEVASPRVNRLNRNANHAVNNNSVLRTHRWAGNLRLFLGRPLNESMPSTQTPSMGPIPVPLSTIPVPSLNGIEPIPVNGIQPIPAPNNGNDIQPIPPSGGSRHDGVVFGAESGGGGFSE